MPLSWRGVAVYAILFACLGFLVPSRMGIDFLDGIVTSCYAAAAPIFATAFVGTERRSVWLATLFGWISVLVTLGLAIVTIQMRYPLGRLLLPPAPVLLAAVPFALAFSYFGAVAGCRMIASGWKPAVAKGMLRRVLLLAILVVLFFTRYLPSVGGSSPAWLTDRNLAVVLGIGTIVALGAGFLMRPREAN
jgi:hypothetical protein